MAATSLKIFKLAGITKVITCYKWVSLEFVTGIWQNHFQEEFNWHEYFYKLEKSFAYLSVVTNMHSNGVKLTHG